MDTLIFGLQIGVVSISSEDSSNKTSDDCGEV